MTKIVLFSIAAGIGGTGAGGLITAMLGRSSDKTTCIFLSFAGGIMTSIVCFGLIPEALAISSPMISFLGLILGIFVVMILNRLVDRLTILQEQKRKIHETARELYHAEKFIASKKGSSLVRSGILILIAIGLHNIPEGLAIGSGGIHDASLGLMLAVMIAVHNIPEGMAIAAPLMAGGVGRLKTVFLTMLSGATTIIGAIIGIYLGKISDMTISLCLSVAGGAMLYVVFGEIIPQAVTMRKDRIPTIVTLVGVLTGFLLTVASSI